MKFLFLIPLFEREFHFKQLTREVENGILMSSSINFFGKMGIKIVGKTEM